MNYALGFSLLLLGGIYLISGQVIRSLGRLVYFVTHSNQAVISVLAFFLLPGTFIHELGHLIVAEFMGVRTDDLNLFPEVGEDRSIKLGGVKVAQTDPIRRTLIGLAPVFGGLLLIWVSSYFITQTTEPLWWLLYGYLLIQVSLTMFSSRKDLEGATVGLGLIFLVLLGVKYLGEIFNSTFLNNLKTLVFQFIDSNLVYLKNGLLLSVLISLGLLIIFNLILGILLSLLRGRS